MSDDDCEIKVWGFIRICEDLLIVYNEFILKNIEIIKELRELDRLFVLYGVVFYILIDIWWLSRIKYYDNNIIYKIW